MSFAKCIWQYLCWSVNASRRFFKFFAVVSCCCKRPLPKLHEPIPHHSLPNHSSRTVHCSRDTLTRQILLADRRSRSSFWKSGEMVVFTPKNWVDLGNEMPLSWFREKIEMVSLVDSNEMVDLGNAFPLLSTIGPLLAFCEPEHALWWHSQTYFRWKFRRTSLRESMGRTVDLPTNLP